MSRMIIFRLTSLILLLLVSCNEANSRFQKYKKGEILLGDKSSIEIIIADDHKRQTLGLSHTKDEQFKNNQGMLFPGNKSETRHFWMPNTYFNLDVIFLTKDLYVLDIHRNVSHYKSDTPNSAVPRIKPVKCTHVLEMKASSKLAKKIKIGQLLKWNSPESLLQIK